MLYDIGEQGPTPGGSGPQGSIQYLVMEYIEGETLAARLLKGPLPLEQTLRYAIEISDALDKAHRKGATHRDIKPGNIMLTKIGGTLGTKLLDFGLAKLKQQAAVKPVALASDAPTPPAGSPLLAHVSSPPQGNPTLGGTILGTVQYMAPEQVEGRVDDIDGRSLHLQFSYTGRQTPRFDQWRRAASLAARRQRVVLFISRSKADGGAHSRRLDD